MNYCLRNGCTAVSKCICCASTNVSLVVSYGSIPLTDCYQPNAEDSVSMEGYPLNLCMCRECSHLQLDTQVDPSLSYTSYLYESSITKGLGRQFKEYADFIFNKHSRAGTKSLLDVGSNDGSFLKSCKEIGIRSYGIEPAKHLSEFASRQGLDTICGFFDLDLVDRLLENGFPSTYDIITFNNVLANMSDPLMALELAKSLLADTNSLISIQTGYHPKQFGNGLFDWVYHEHYSYFSLRSLAVLAKRVGLHVTDYSFSELRGGSMRVLLSVNESSFEPGYEYFSQTNHFVGLRSFIAESGKQLMHQILRLKESGFKIYGYGASHSTGILVHSFNIACLLTGLYDDNKRKHGLYMPGTALMVEDSEDIRHLSTRDSAIVVLAWQYFDIIASRIRSLGFDGNIIKPTLL